MPPLFGKKISIFEENSIFGQSNSNKDFLVFSFCKIKGCYQWKCRNYRQCVRNLAFGLLQIRHNRKNNDDVIICPYDVIMTLSRRYRFSRIKLSYWSKLMSISLLVPKLWHFLFIRDRPGIRKLEISPPEFRLIYGHWDKVSWGHQIWQKCPYGMLQNFMFTANIVSGLFKKNQQERYKYPPPQIRVTVLIRMLKRLEKFSMFLGA